MNYFLFLLLLWLAPISQGFGQSLLLPGQKTTEVRKVSGKEVIFRVKALKIKGDILEQKFFILDKKKQTILAVVTVEEVNKKGFALGIISESLVEDTTTLKGYPVAYAKHIDLPESEQKPGAGAFSYGVTLVNPTILSFMDFAQIDFHYLPVLIGYDAHPQMALYGMGVSIFPPYLKFSSWLSRFGLVYRRQMNLGTTKVDVESTLGFPPVKVIFEQESLNLCYRPYFDGIISRVWACVTAVDRSISKLTWGDEDFVLSAQGMGFNSGIEFIPVYPGLLGFSFSLPMKQKILMSESGSSDLKQGTQNTLLGQVFTGVRYRFSQTRSGLLFELLGQYSFYTQKLSVPNEPSLEYQGSEYRASIGLGYIF